MTATIERPTTTADDVTTTPAQDPAQGATDQDPTPTDQGAQDPAQGAQVPPAIVPTDQVPTPDAVASDLVAQDPPTTDQGAQGATDQGATAQDPATTDQVPTPAPLQTPPAGAGLARDQRPDEIRLLGYTVTWRVTGTLVGRADLRERMEAAGIGDQYPKAPPALDTALRRAIVEWAKNRTGIDFATGDKDDDDVIGRKKLIREIPRPAGSRMDKTGVVFALVQEQGLEAALSLRYAVSYRIALIPPATLAGEWQLVVSNTARGVMGPDERAEQEAERQQVEAAIRAAWEKHKNYYTGAQISPILREIMLQWNAVSIEAGTGAWYVPGEDQGSKVDALERFVRGLPVRSGGTPAHLRVHEQIDWPRSRASLAEAAQEFIAQEIKAADRRLGDYTEAAESKPGSVKTSTLMGLLDELAAVRNKAALYADTVGMRQGRLQKQAADVGDRTILLAKQQRDSRLGRAVVVVAAPAQDPAQVAQVPTPEATPEGAAAAPDAVAVAVAVAGEPVEATPEVPSLDTVASVEAVAAAAPVAVAVTVARPERQQRATR